MVHMINYHIITIAIYGKSKVFYSNATLLFLLSNIKHTPNTIYPSEHLYNTMVYWCQFTIAKYNHHGNYIIHSVIAMPNLKLP